MSKPWPIVKFKRFLKPNSRPHELAQDEDANLVGMRWYGEGPFHREYKPAMNIAKKSHFVIRTDDIIYNKLFAWKGSFGVVPSELDGMFVSDKFPTYETDPNQADLNYLRWCFRWPPLWEQSLALSTGSAAISKLTLNPPKFLELSIPLPPLPEQQRIVAHIEELASRIAEATRLRDEVSNASNDFLASVCFDRSVATSPNRMRTLVRLREPNVSVIPEESYRFAGVYCFGRGVFRGDLKQGMEFSYRTLTRLCVGNFIYPKLMAWEGAFGLTPEECAGLVVSPEFPVFEIDETRVLPEVLEMYFKIPHVWEQIKDISTGTNVRRRRLKPDAFLNYEFPLPPMPVQQRVRQISKKLQQASQWKREQRRELDGLLPSILDKAFRGEL